MTDSARVSNFRHREDGLGLAGYLKAVPSHGRTSDMVTEILREAILDGVLKPHVWLREEELAQELAVSRTPVREALRRLAVEGLVTINAHQGAVVESLTLEDVLEIYVVRENLEGLAARLAAKHRSKESLEQLDEVLLEMQEAAAANDAASLAKLNIRFHKIIRLSAGNRYLDHFLTQIEHAVRRFGHTTYEIPGRAFETLQEHKLLCDAIASGIPDDAARCAMDHMRKARGVRIRMLMED